MNVKSVVIAAAIGGTIAANLSAQAAETIQPTTKRARWRT